MDTVYSGGVTADPARRAGAPALRGEGYPTPEPSDRVPTQWVETIEPVFAMPS